MPAQDHLGSRLAVSLADFFDPSILREGRQSAQENDTQKVAAEHGKPDIPQATRGPQAEPMGDRNWPMANTTAAQVKTDDATFAIVMHLRLPGTIRPCACSSRSGLCFVDKDGIRFAAPWACTCELQLELRLLEPD